MKGKIVNGPALYSIFRRSPHGKTLQNVHAMLLTGSGCSVGSLNYTLEELLTTSNA
jgi:hypothetical protein